MHCLFPLFVYLSIMPHSLPSTNLPHSLLLAESKLSNSVLPGQSLHAWTASATPPLRRTQPNLHVLLQTLNSQRTGAVCLWKASSRAFNVSALSSLRLMSASPVMSSLPATCAQQQNDVSVQIISLLLATCAQWQQASWCTPAYVPAFCSAVAIRQSQHIRV